MTVYKLGDGWGWGIMQRHVLLCNMNLYSADLVFHFSLMLQLWLGLYLWLRPVLFASCNISLSLHFAFLVLLSNIWFCFVCSIWSYRQIFVRKRTRRKKQRSAGIYLSFSSTLAGGWHEFSQHAHQRNTYCTVIYNLIYNLHISKCPFLNLHFCRL